MQRIKKGAIECEDDCFIPNEIGDDKELEEKERKKEEEERRKEEEERRKEEEEERRKEEEERKKEEEERKKELEEEEREKELEEEEREKESGMGSELTIGMNINGLSHMQRIKKGAIECEDDSFIPNEINDYPMRNEDLLRHCHYSLSNVSNENLRQGPKHPRNGGIGRKSKLDGASFWKRHRRGGREWMPFDGTDVAPSRWKGMERKLDGAASNSMSSRMARKPDTSAQRVAQRRLAKLVQQPSSPVTWYGDHLAIHEQLKQLKQLNQAVENKKLRAKKEEEDRKKEEEEEKRRKEEEEREKENTVPEEEEEEEEKEEEEQDTAIQEDTEPVIQEDTEPAIQPVIQEQLKQVIKKMARQDQNLQKIDEALQRVGNLIQEAADIEASPQEEAADIEASPQEEEIEASPFMEISEEGVISHHEIDIFEWMRKKKEETLRKKKEETLDEAVEKSNPVTEEEEKEEKEETKEKKKTRRKKKQTHLNYFVEEGEEEEGRTRRKTKKKTKN